MTSVGYIGLGAMGMPMAMGALAAGFDVWVHDLQLDRMQAAAAKGAHAAATPRDLAGAAEIVALVVKGDGPAERVALEGILPDARRGQTLVIHSTVHPRTIHRIAAAAGPVGVAVVDAQMTGGQIGAEAHELCFMVGGDADAVERVRPLLATTAREIHRVGGLGAGSAMKLVQQTVFCLNRLAAYEGMRLAAAAGLELEGVQRVLGRTAAQSFVVDNWLGRYRLLDADDERSGLPGWPIREFARLLLSVTPALELAHEHGVELPATALMQSLFPVERQAAKK
jgi:3-hydroxyisobutyrate dehydrogenase